MSEAKTESEVANAAIAETATAAIAAIRRRAAALLLPLRAASPELVEGEEEGPDFDRLSRGWVRGKERLEKSATIRSSAQVLMAKSSNPAGGA